jgi:secreted trypsin-like serine protease
MLQAAAQLVLLGTLVVGAPLPLDRVGRKSGYQKVVNGQDAPEDKYPWVVGLEAKIKGEFYSCGGSLIAPGYVLTAAHCFFPSNGKTAGTVYFGAHETCFYGDCNAEKRTIARAIIHPNYNEQTSANDVAILQLAAPMNTIEPVPIKNVAYAKQDSFANGAEKAAMTFGWGVVNTATEAMGQVLQQGNVNLIARTTCGTKHGYAKSDIKAGMMCANHPKGTDACQGDSGGPLFSASRGELVGVVSWGQGCGERNYPGVYADVGHYYSWITGITGSLNDGGAGGGGGGGVTDAPATDAPATDAPAVTNAPVTTECVCKSTWDFDGASYSGCTVTPDDLSTAWCYTTAPCAGSTASESITDAQWANCDEAPPAPTDAPTTDTPPIVCDACPSGMVEDPSGGPCACMNAPTPATPAPSPAPAPPATTATSQTSSPAASTDAPFTDACVCRDKWSYEPTPFAGYETFQGCAETNGEHWCFTTAECADSSPSELFAGWHWAGCEPEPTAVETCSGQKKNACKKDSACKWKRGQCNMLPEAGSCAAANNSKQCSKANNNGCDWVGRQCVDALVCEDSASKCCAKNKNKCNKDYDCEFHRNSQCMPMPLNGDGSYGYVGYNY